MLSRTGLLSLIIASLLTACLGTSASRSSAANGARPNVVLIFTDDQGYGDLSSYGHPTIHTPNIDRLGSEGVKLTQFYAASPVCSPSRAALLTGCYPKRVGIHRHVIFPEYDYGLHTDEVTLADMLGGAGYATGCFGKWHLGHRPGLLPTDQGFDTFHGVPYSNDMAQIHRPESNDYAYRLPWMHDSEVVEWEPDQGFLTQRTTDHAIDFIRRNAERPFFAYIPYSMPHVPLYASKAHAGTSPRGLYGDVIEEIDAGVGRILDTLDEFGLGDDTLVIFTSDNGPWLWFKEEGGSAGLLRGGKATNWEGGQRVPFLARWPLRIPSGTVRREVVTALDIFPTLAAFAGVELSSGRRIDGLDASSVFTGVGLDGFLPKPFLYFTPDGDLAGIRRGPWKLLLKSNELFQVETDVSEKWDVASEHPELVEELRALALEQDQRLEQESRPSLAVAETIFDPQKPDR